MGVESVNDVPSRAKLDLSPCRSLDQGHIVNLIRRGFKYKLDPTAEQEVLFRQFAGACRAVYNTALYQRQNFWRQYAARTGGRISYASQCRELTTLRASFNWIAAVSQTCQQQALRDLDKAYQNFFAGRAKVSDTAA
ncbi:transposase [Bradyrhizobium iriomotense]|uniref:Transposase putative helix-turn-helix domain-containing protein n=1 Tax=Bradyrhizobium iriomotense TaxID=441950 RepID=A0ABQ6BF96_9BRAD|nr:transposase [Bradyrhizobium iriomotense]GLR92370.1 hypothetical protein GCM10007857_90990 [Bradyrhizobium iriomotense]